MKHNNTLTRILLTVVATCALWHTSAQAQMSPQQSQLLVNNCVQCHAEPHIGAPMFGDAQTWTAIMAKGEDAVLQNVVLGLGSMPPLGYCSACSEEDFRVLIRALAGLPVNQTSRGQDDGEGR